MSKLHSCLIIMILSGLISSAGAQSPPTSIQGRVIADGQPLTMATVAIPSLQIGGLTDSLGNFTLTDLPPGTFTLEASYIGYFTAKQEITLQSGIHPILIVELTPKTLDEIVVTGTMREVRRSASIIPVDIISSKLFGRNPTPNIFESAGMISGVQPVMNCNVCNTGDIQINGMEGVYTQVLLDGMPIVSGLGTVYGLMGIPNSLIDRIEVAKGPAGALYGSEAMAGQINIITKSPQASPLLSLDLHTTTWGETNLDAGTKIRLGKVTGLLGLNGFLFQNPVDQNQDGFTDVAQQKRISLFNKWAWQRPHNRIAQLGVRYVWEDRWGGQTHWTPDFRGGDEIYAESILTNRLEVLGQYQLPTTAPIILQASYSRHFQDSYYGEMAYKALQDISFIQAYWNKQLAAHNLLIGTAMRYTVYNDNTPATQTADRILLPGIFIQDEWEPDGKNHFLGGLRLDLHPSHGAVWSPRLAWHRHIGEFQNLRLSTGTGFRVVSLFTEDHAALSGSREVIITEALNPEKSWSGNLNYNWIIPKDTWYLNLDATAFYTLFTNRIIPDYDTNPQQIIYANLKGRSITKGFTLQGEFSNATPLLLTAGLTYMEVYQVNEEDLRTVQIKAPRWSGVFAANYTHPRSRLSIDITGQWFSPQRLPVVPEDFRPEYSPWYTLINLKISRTFKYNLELYAGVKNLLNFIPSNPILRPFDPFDKTVDDPVNNPNGYTFDPNYNFAPLQGIRGYFGVRYTL